MMLKIPTDTCAYKSQELCVYLCSNLFVERYLPKADLHLERNTSENNSSKKIVIFAPSVISSPNVVLDMKTVNLFFIVIGPNVYVRTTI